jgi:predicted DCC family thiol-disulfide oxidoreductase YuxK
LVFDGTCGFCTRSVRWVEARDRAGRVEAVHAQALGCRERFCLTQAETDRAAWIEARIYAWVTRNRPLLSRLWGTTPPCDEPGASCL